MRDEAERERNRRVLGEFYHHGGGEKEVGGTGCEEGKGSKRGEKIRVYASPDLKEGGGK